MAAATALPSNLGTSGLPVGMVGMCGTALPGLPIRDGSVGAEIAAAVASALQQAVEQAVACQAQAAVAAAMQAGQFPGLLTAAADLQALAARQAEQLAAQQDLQEAAIRSVQQALGGGPPPPLARSDNSVLAGPAPPFGVPAPQGWMPLPPPTLFRVRSPRRNRSRSPRRPPEAGAGDRGIVVEVPSSKLGQLVGFKGLTIQRIKDTCGVSVLHIDDRDKAKARSQPTIPVEMSGTEEQVSLCQCILQEVCNGDQTSIGHLTALLSIESVAVGKIMGNKGMTVKLLSEEASCYIEIQQDRSRGANDTPRLFIAGLPHQVEYAVQLINRFIASPGSKLDFVLKPDPSSSAKGGPLADPLKQRLTSVLQPMLAALTGSLPVQSALLNALSMGGPVALSAFEPDGPKEERIIEIPARKKSHLVGLRGQTIELVQRTAGVLKCHIMVDRDKYEYDKDGSIPLQICGTRDRVEHCVQIIERIIAGDYSGIGHACHVMPIEQARVNYLRGDRWQVINYLKDLTGCYMDVIQGPPYGLARGEAQLFMTGPVERVARARAIVDTMLANMDKIQMPDINIDAPWRKDEEAAKKKMEEEERGKKPPSRRRRRSPSP